MGGGGSTQMIAELSSTKRGGFDDHTLSWTHLSLLSLSDLPSKCTPWALRSSLRRRGEANYPRAHRQRQRCPELQFRCIKYRKCEKVATYTQVYPFTWQASTRFFPIRKLLGASLALQRWLRQTIWAVSKECENSTNSFRALLRRRASSELPL